MSVGLAVGHTHQLFATDNKSGQPSVAAAVAAASLTGQPHPIICPLHNSQQDPTVTRPCE